MSYTPRRRPEELPRSVAGIRLAYEHQGAGRAGTLEDAVEQWMVRITAPDASVLDKEPADRGHFVSVGHLRLWRFNASTPGAVGRAAGSASPAVASIAEPLLDPTCREIAGLYWSRAAEESFQLLDNDLLVVETVVLEPQWRGFGLSALVLTQVIRVLGRACGLVACRPVPAVAEDAGVVGAGASGLAGLAADVGFRHFKDGVYVLDLATDAAEEARRDWQIHFGRRPEEFEAISQAISLT